MTTNIPHDQLRQMTLAQLNAIVSDKTIASTDAATTSAAGLVELATDAEMQAGTDTTRVVTAAGLKSAVPFTTTASMNLYVNSGAAYGSYGAGSDSNAGTQAAPFATIAAAIAKIPQVLAHSISINLAGEPNYYQWLPDGTNGIKFTTGDSGVTVAVAAGSTLSVALSGSAVTITLATGGSTIAQIIAAINNSATVGPVIFPIAVGTPSTNITATLSAQALTGGNVRTYAESVRLDNFVGGSLYISASGTTVNLGARLEADYSAGSAVTINTRCSVLLYRLAIRTTVTSTYAAIAAASATTCYAVYLHVSGVFGSSTFMRGAIEASGGANIQVTVCHVYSATNAFLAKRNGLIVIEGIFGGGNGVGLRTHGGILIKLSGGSISASTPEVASPAGTIL